MMDASQVVVAVESATCIALLVPLLTKLVAAHRLVSFRQQMFALRDELFDYAASGKISFSDPAYRLLRRSMNGFIRYAHQLTVFQLFMTIMRLRVLGEKPDFEWDRSWEAALADIRDEDVRSQLRNFQSRAVALVAVRVVTGSPVLLSAVPLTALLYAARKSWYGLRQLFSASAAATVARLVDIRLLEEEAAARAA